MKVKQGLKTIKQAGRRRRSRWLAGGLILLYHRVASVAVEYDPFGLAVSPPHFAEQMAVLRQRYHPVPLPQLAESRQRPTQPPSIAITFDDGYVDNLRHALPILERYEIPATIFVTSGTLDHDFWWERLTRVMGQPQLPDTLPWPEFSWRNDATARSRKHLLKQLHRWLRPHPEAERNDALAELERWVGLVPQPLAARPLTDTEFRQLAASPLIEIGGHTASHPALVDLSPAAQLAEMVAGKRALEARLNRTIVSFAYPFGTANDYTATTVELVRQAGFQQACAAEPDLVHGRSDRWQLPRLWGTDVNGAAFGKEIAQWVR